MFKKPSLEPLHRRRSRPLSGWTACRTQPLPRPAQTRPQLQVSIRRQCPRPHLGETYGSSWRRGDARGQASEPRRPVFCRGCRRRHSSGCVRALSCRKHSHLSDWSGLHRPDREAGVSRRRSRSDASIVHGSIACCIVKHAGLQSRAASFFRTSWWPVPRSKSVRGALHLKHSIRVIRQRNSNLVSGRHGCFFEWVQLCMPHGSCLSAPSQDTSPWGVRLVIACCSPGLAHPSSSGSPQTAQAPCFSTEGNCKRYVARSGLPPVHVVIQCCVKHRAAFSGLSSAPQRMSATHARRQTVLT